MRHGLPMDTDVDVGGTSMSASKIQKLGSARLFREYYSETQEQQTNREFVPEFYFIFFLIEKEGRTRDTKEGKRWKGRSPTKRAT